MKKKINVQLHKNGENSRFLLDCIGAYNAGKCNFSARDLEGYIAMQKAYLPVTGKGFGLIKWEEKPNTYLLTDDGGETFVMTIEFAETYELKEDTPETLFQSPSIKTE